MLDNEGYVAEGTGENVFIVRDGVLHTPELTSCLDGITRNTCFTLRKSSASTIGERTNHPGRGLYRRRGVLHGTRRGSVADSRARQPVIGIGGRGPITEKLQTMYFDQVRGQRSAIRSGRPRYGRLT